jgi:outer membrane protein TolC
MKERDNPVWSVGATLLAPIFNAGALQAQVDVRTAEQKAAVGRLRPHRLARLRRGGRRAVAVLQPGQPRRRAGARGARQRIAVGYARTRYDVGSGDLRGVQQQLLALHAPARRWRGCRASA